MPHSVTVDLEQRIITIVYTQDIDLAALQAGMLDAARQALAHQFSRILINCQVANLKLSTVEIYHLPSTLARLFVETFPTTDWSIQHFKRALVVSRNVSDYTFIETVTQNRAQIAKFFFTVAEAQAWLMQES